MRHLILEVQSWGRGWDRCFFPWSPCLHSVAESMAFGPRAPGTVSWPWHLPAEWPSSSYFVTVCFTFLTCKMRVTFMCCVWPTEKDAWCRASQGWYRSPQIYQNVCPPGLVQDGEGLTRPPLFPKKQLTVVTGGGGDIFFCSVSVSVKSPSSFLLYATLIKLVDLQLKQNKTEITTDNKVCVLVGNTARRCKGNEHSCVSLGEWPWMPLLGWLWKSCPNSSNDTVILSDQWNYCCQPSTLRSSIHLQNEYRYD